MVGDSSAIRRLLGTEVEQRVNAWITANRGRVHQAGWHEDFDFALDQWRDCCNRWGATSAAAIGALVSVVREVYEDNYASPVASFEIRQGQRVASWSMCGAGKWRTEYAAVVAALEEANL